MLYAVRINVQNMNLRKLTNFIFWAFPVGLEQALGLSVSALKKKTSKAITS